MKCEKDSRGSGGGESIYEGRYPRTGWDVGPTPFPRGVPVLTSLTAARFHPNSVSIPFQFRSNSAVQTYALATGWYNIDSHESVCRRFSPPVKTPATKHDQRLEILPRMFDV